jgi:galactose mutarotase-like enzyme
MLQPKTLTYNQSSLTLYPDRWGIITSMRIRDTELLYQGMLDETLYDTTKSVRWGIPILFPNAGFLTDDEKKSTWWNLPQHGFARTNEWNIINESNNQIIQSLVSSDIEDMYGYKWLWSIENNITLSQDWIQLKYFIANNSNNGLPISLGLHPYWSVPLGDKSAIEWNFAWGDIIARDIENWSRGGTTRIDIPSDYIVSFTIPWVGTIELQLPPEFRRLWIWSLSDKNFVCVEPMMWDDGNIVQDPVKVPVGGKNEYWIQIRYIA